MPTSSVTLALPKKSIFRSITDGITSLGGTLTYVRSRLGSYITRTLILPALDEFKMYNEQYLVTLSEIQKKYNINGKHHGFLEFINEDYFDSHHIDEYTIQEGIYCYLLKKNEPEFWKANHQNKDYQLIKYQSKRKKYVNSTEGKEIFEGIKKLHAYYTFTKQLDGSTYQGELDALKKLLNGPFAQMQSAPYNFTNVTVTETKYNIGANTLAGLTLTASMQETTDQRPKLQTLYIMGNSSCYQDGTTEIIAGDIDRVKEHFNVTAHVVNPRGVANSTGTPWFASDLIEDYYAIAKHHIDQESARLREADKKLTADAARRQAAETFEIRGHSLGGAYGTMVAAKLHKTGYPVRLLNERSFSSPANQVVGLFAGSNKFLRAIVRLGTRIIGWHMDAAEAYESIPEEYKSYYIVKNSLRAYIEKYKNDYPEFVDKTSSEIKAILLKKINENKLNPEDQKAKNAFEELKQLKEADGVITYTGSLHFALKKIRKNEKEIIQAIKQNLALLAKDDTWGKQAGITIEQALVGNLNHIGSKDARTKLEKAYKFIEKNSGNLEKWYENTTGQQLQLKKYKISEIDELLKAIDSFYDQRFNAQRMNCSDGEPGHNLGANLLESWEKKTHTAENYTDNRQAVQYKLLYQRRQEKQQGKQPDAEHNIQASLTNRP